MHVFVYGSLTEPVQVSRVLDSYVFVGPAVLSGLHAVEGEYPTLAPGGSVGGRLMRTEDVDALDAYEGVDRGLYVRVSVPFCGDAPDDPDDVEVYVGDPAALGVSADVDWSGDEEADLATSVAAYVAAHDVAVSPA